MWRKWIVTLGGAGLLPLGPGTWGSLLTTSLLLEIYASLGPGAGGAWAVILAAGVLGFGALSIALAPWAVAHFGRKDPGAFVLDEAAGICLTWLFLPELPGRAQAWVALAVFAAFRVFDISKPPPARQLERLPGGWGILLDDLMAAVYANVLCQIGLRVLLRNGIL